MDPRQGCRGDEYKWDNGNKGNPRHYQHQALGILRGHQGAMMEENGSGLAHDNYFITRAQVLLVNKGGVQSNQEHQKD